MISSSCPLIFVHVPKTGGMSMFASMAEQYGTRIADMYNLSAYESDPAPAKDMLENTDYMVYAGHFPFGLHQWLARPACYMAFVRKPVERIASLYYYSVQYRATIRKTRKETGRSFRELFDSKDAADFYEDFLPWVEGEESLHRFLQCQSPELDNGMVRRFSGVGLSEGACPASALEQARENIERYFSVVGVQERYAESIGLARMIFKMPLTEFHVNRGTEKRQKGKKIPIAIKRRIKEMNALDTKLYQWVEARLEQQQRNPPQPLQIAGGGRDDFENVPLWRAIGSSPIRKMVMEQSPASR